MVNFGIIYGISSFGLSENLGIERDAAQELIDTYLARLPRVQELIARTIAQAAADGYVDHAARPPPADPRASGVEPPDALARRAARREHRDAGHRGRRDQGGDGADPRAPPPRGPRVPARAPGPRRAAARGARGGDERRARARPRGDGGRLSARPARSPSRPASATPGPTRRARLYRPGSGLALTRISIGIGHPMVLDERRNVDQDPRVSQGKRRRGDIE